MLECLACAYAIEEVQGFIEEGQEEAKIEAYLQSRVCARLQPSASYLVRLPFFRGHIKIARITY